MARLIGILLVLFTSFASSAQQLMLPRESNIYPDSIAIYLKNFASTPGKVSVSIVSRYGDQYFKEITSDSIVIAPYYLVYDDEPMLILSAENTKSIRARYIENFAKLRPLKKNDSIEASIYRVLENENEANLVALGKIYERHECYINALFVYFKLYQLGFQSYWNDLVRDRIKLPPLTPNVHRYNRG
jgi:hypothetical protein